ncbi:MAG: redoxin domain-containing protein [Archangium sp.]|nr:redoxin domain-containing protein [Archangium sp.]MDP3152719.1 redoxin domain-containing protein [Archangium sp.]MDP3573506.1 redoxin domain-containing protein [Archangium sp.]
MPNLIKTGDSLPKLTLAYRGSPFRVTPGRSGALLYFMRAANCAVCRAHVKRLVQFASQAEAAGFTVAIVVPDAAGAAEVASSLKTPFPVVSGSEAHNDVGLSKVLFGIVQQSGTVVTDGQGNVVVLVRATLPTSAFPEDEVLALFERSTTHPGAITG